MCSSSQRKQSTRDPGMLLSRGKFTVEASVNFYNALQQKRSQVSGARRGLKLSSPASLLVPNAPTSCSDAIKTLCGSVAKQRCNAEASRWRRECDDIDDDFCAGPGNMHSGAFTFSSFEELNNPSLSGSKISTSVVAIASSFRLSRSHKRKAVNAFDSSEQSGEVKFEALNDDFENYMYDILVDSDMDGAKGSGRQNSSGGSNQNEREFAQLSSLQEVSRSAIRTNFRDFRKFGDGVLETPLYSVDSLASRPILPVSAVRTALTETISPPTQCTVELNHVLERLDISSAGSDECECAVRCGDVLSVWYFF